MSEPLIQDLALLAAGGHVAAGQAIAEIERLTALVAQHAAASRSRVQDLLWDDKGQVIHQVVGQLRDPDSIAVRPAVDDVRELSVRDSALTNSFIDSYEFDPGEGSPYVPSEHESMLIADAIHGLLAIEEWSDAHFAWEVARRAARAAEAGQGAAATAVPDCRDRVPDLKIALDLARRALADGRRAGRAEAFGLLTNYSAEDFPEDFIVDEVGGGTGELMFSWNAEKLRDLFDLEVDDPTLSLIDRISGAWWEQEYMIGELRSRLKNGPRPINTLADFCAEAKLLDLRADDLVPKLRLRPEFAAEVAAAELDNQQGRIE